MKIKRFNESVERVYQNDGSNRSCPVCNNWKNLKISGSDVSTDGMEYYYECPECDFKWYEKYVMVLDGAYEYNEGEEIQKGQPINPNLYNELKLQTDKYNI